MTWSEVQGVHRTQKGIYMREGSVISLLCNQTKDAKYADEVHDDMIKYRVTSSTPQVGVRSLEAMVGCGQTLHVFEKLGVNQWFDHGLWCVAESHQQDMWTKTFVLRRPRTVA
jgi:hypothetical protein